MIMQIFEGECVRHTTEKFVGLHIGYTRLTALLERSSDVRGVRVQLPDGTIRIVSEHNLQKAECTEYDQYAASIGVDPKSRKRHEIAARV